MVIAETPGWLGDATGWVGFLIASFTLTGLMIKYFILPSLKSFISDQTDPLKDKIDKIDSIVRKELEPNGGTSIKDRINNMQSDIKILKIVHNLENKKDS